MKTQNKLTLSDCRKNLPADIKIADNELSQIRDFFYEFSEIILQLDKKEVA